MKLKHKLPLCHEIEHLNLAADELHYCKIIIKESENKFKTALEANGQLCRFHPGLTNETYQELLQISLTDSEYDNDTLTLDEYNTVESIGNFRDRMQLANSHDSVFSEHSFTEPTDDYLRHRDFFDRIKNNFLSPVTRMRLVKLPAGKNITPHIDYDPSYAVRIIIPIQTDDNCLNLFWKNNKLNLYTFQTGKAYFLNTGYRHAVCNLSKFPRYTLMITVNGTMDISNIISDNAHV